MQSNIIVLLLDTARYDHFGCYGYDKETTPFIDTLADEGVLYEQAYSNSIWSLPAYASIFTGEYPSQHGAVDWGKQITRNSLVEGLSERGYRTHSISPHLVSGEFNIKQAFDSAEWVRKPGIDLIFEDDTAVERVREGARSGELSSTTDKGLALFKYMITEKSWQSVPNGLYYLYCKFARQRGWWSDDGAGEVFNRARQFVSDVSEPFFLFTNFVEPHDPYRPPKDYIRKFMPPGVSLAEMNEVIETSFIEVTIGAAELTTRQQKILAALHDAELRYLDDQIRDFYEYLLDTGKAEDSVVAIFSDHGDLWGEAGIWGHQARIHPKLCRVPLIISYPWNTPKTKSEVVELVDLHSHFLSLADGQHTLLSGDSAIIEYYGWDTQLSFKPWDKYEDFADSQFGQYQASIVRDGYQLYWDAMDIVELYETTEQSAGVDVSDRYPDIVERLKVELEQTVGNPAENHRAYRREKAGKGLAGHSDEVQRRLADLGYL